MYIWGAKVAPESTTVSALTTRIRMIAVASDEEGSGAGRATAAISPRITGASFGEEPGRVTAIELMTDTDNTGGLAEAYLRRLERLAGA